MIFRNNTPDLTLASAVGPTDTTITVNEDVSWVEPGMVLVIDLGTSTEEAIFVQAVDPITKSLMVVRGVDGYTAQAHSAGATVRHMVTALSLSMSGAGSMPFVLRSGSWWCPAYTNLGKPSTDSVSWGNGLLAAIAFSVRLKIKQIAIAFSTAGSSDGTTHFALYNTYLTYPELVPVPKYRVWKTTFVADAAATYYFDLTSSPLIVRPGIYFWAIVNQDYTTDPTHYAWSQSSIPLVISQHLGPDHPTQGQWKIGHRYSASGAFTNTGDPTPPDIEPYLLWDLKNHAFAVWLQTELV